MNEPRPGRNGDAEQEPERLGLRHPPSHKAVQKQPLKPHRTGEKDPKGHDETVGNRVSSGVKDPSFTRRFLCRSGAARHLNGSLSPSPRSAFAPFLIVLDSCFQANGGPGRERSEPSAGFSLVELSLWPGELVLPQPMSR